jgi:hypothetical protein
MEKYLSGSAEAHIERARQIIDVRDRLRTYSVIVQDINEVNSRLQTSSRPDLVMTRPVPQEMYSTECGGLWNFQARMIGLRPLRPWNAETVGCPNPTLLTDDEYNQIIVRGGQLSEAAFTGQYAALRMDTACRHYFQTMTHIERPAFIRMMIICNIDSLGLELLNAGIQRKKEEIFAVYLLMRELVDENDHGVNGRDNVFST